MPTTLLPPVVPLVIAPLVPVRAVAEGDSSGIRNCAVVPLRTADDIIAVRQRGHSADADTIKCRRTDERVRARYRAARAVAPRRRSDVLDRAVIPTRTGNDIIAVRQRDDTAVADLIKCRRADERIGARNCAADAGHTVTLPLQHCQARRCPKTDCGRQNCRSSTRLCRSYQHYHLPSNRRAC